MSQTIYSGNEKSSSGGKANELWVKTVEIGIEQRCSVMVRGSRGRLNVESRRYWILSGNILV